MQKKKTLNKIRYYLGYGVASVSNWLELLALWISPDAYDKKITRYLRGLSIDNVDEDSEG